MFTLIGRHGLVLATFALFCTFLVSLTFNLTKNKIAEQEALARLVQVQQVLPQSLYDNNLLASCVQITAPDYLGNDKPHTVYIAKKLGEISGYAIETTAPDGYSGNIDLIVGVTTQGDIMGVRVLSHQETPGLGDKIELRKSPWILSFNLHSLRSLSETSWSVKKDGGVFDAFTGATITPRAVVKRVYHTLRLLDEQPNLIPQASQCEMDQ